MVRTIVVVVIVGIIDVAVIGGPTAGGAAPIRDAFTAFLLGLDSSFLGDESLQAREPTCIERARIDRGTHRATGFAVVFAVAEPTVIHQIEHIGEGALDASTRQPQTDRPKSGGIDEPTARRKRQQS